MLLLRAAEKSIDLQYYIWHDDLTGRLLFHEVRAAAQRGVRIRLLLDDNNSAGLDPLLKTLDDHPNIEVRLFNPFTVRKARTLGWAADFWRLNRRMHNKTFTVDGQVSIVGGRNIGDEYFGAAAGTLFVDLDTIAVGPIVANITTDFDRYWSSQSSYPASLLIRSTGQHPVTRSAPAQNAERQAYMKVVAKLPIVSALLDGRLDLIWAKGTLISDDPGKALGKATPSKLVIGQLEQVLGQPRKRLGLISGYFVPTHDTVAFLTKLSDQGVDVEVVTNAVEATDVPVVHAGYAGDRLTLLQHGVRLWEIKSSSTSPRHSKTFGSGSGITTGGVPQRPGQALHAKTFTVDGQRIFIGSFNLDPRSAKLNTELGIVIESRELTQGVDNALAAGVAEASYEVQEAGGELRWIEQRQSGRQVHTTEPGTTRLSRTITSLLSKLPIEWLL